MHVDQLQPPEPPKPVTINVTPHGDRTPGREDKPKGGKRKPRSQSQNRISGLGSQPTKRAKEYLDFLYQAWKDDEQPMEIRLKAGKDYAAIMFGAGTVPMKSRGHGQSSGSVLNIIGIPQPQAPALPTPDQPPRSIIEQLPASVSLGDARMTFDVPVNRRNGTAD